MKKIAVLHGDGIGRDVVDEAIKILKTIGEKYNISFQFIECPVGGTAYDLCGIPLPKETLDVAKASEAVLLGAVGGPKWDELPYDLRPERALLGLRKELDLFANLRPAKLFPSLINASPLKGEIVSDVDLLVIRELVSGIYFGMPRGIDKIDENNRRGYNTASYTTGEVERIATTAFEIALKRKKRVTSVDKANVLETSVLWRETVKSVHKRYPEVELMHMYIDNCAMQLIKCPKQFDVIVTSNMFGDILSDEAAMLTGSIGMLPSASIGNRSGMYEPVHGSAPDIAGKDIANPIAAILSAAMMLRYSFDLIGPAMDIEDAVANVLEDGYRTKDIDDGSLKVVGTTEMGSVIDLYIRESSLCN